MTVNGKESSIEEEIFDKTSEHIAWLVNKMWLSRYPRCCYIIYNNVSEFKLKFYYLCETYGIGKWLNCSACSLFCMQVCYFCNVLPFCIRQNIFVRMVDIFHSIINEWAKFDTKDVFSFINF
jgi:hypothetical protein